MKRFYRSKTNRVLGGVAGGLGEYLQIDPTLIRVAFLVASLVGGLGLLLYFVLWISAPERDTLAEERSTEEAEFSYVKEEGKKEPSVSEEKTKDTSNACKEKYKSCKKCAAQPTFWGLLFFVLGLLWIGENLNLFSFRFCSLWRLWPIVFCCLGLNMIPMHKGVRWVLNILLLLLALALVFYVGFTSGEECNWVYLDWD